MRWLKFLGLGLFLLLVAVEIALRLTGLGDFPLYVIDPEVGYRVAPNQHGTFLHSKHWTFNEYGMGTGPFRPRGKRNVLVVGDSIVLGGNPLDQPVRLGPTLERDLGTGWAVWPLAAQGWSSVNKAAWLQRETGIVSQMEWVVWVMKSGDFQGLSVWRSSAFNPLHHPLWLTASLFEKQIWIFRIRPHLPIWALGSLDPILLSPREAKVPEVGASIRQLAQAHPGVHFLLVWYPEAAELHPPPYDPYLTLGAHFKALAAAEHLSFVDIAKEPGWSAADYRDQIHPNAAGDAALAAILQRIIASGPTPSPTP